MIENKRQQQMHGPYQDFDPSKMLMAELAVVTSGDPASNTGRSLYVCFVPGVVKRIVSYEDLENEMQNASADVQAAFTKTIQNAILSANTAASAANAAKAAADRAAEAANKAAAACEGIIDNSRLTALEDQMEQVIAALKNTLSTQ